MSEKQEVTQVLSQAITKSDSSKDTKELSLEALVLLLTTDRLHHLEKQSRKELDELRGRQKKVAFLNKLTKTINTATGPKGDFDMGNYTDLQNMLSDAKKIGIEVDEAKVKYNDEERQRLVDNIRMTIDDMNVENEMHLFVV